MTTDLLSDISIVVCRPQDAARLELIGRATFLETFAGLLDGDAIRTHCANAHSAAAYESLLASGAVAWLATISPGGTPIGYAVLAPSDLPIASRDDTDLEIKRIYVLHRFQGMRLGQRLLAAAEETARHARAERLLLGVYARNTSAQAFYRRAGFAEAGRRTFRVGAKDYDDVVMAKPLVEAVARQPELAMEAL